MSVISFQGWKQCGKAREGSSGYGMSALTTGWTGAKEGGHPQVGWSCVKDNLEFLRGCSNGDFTHVEHLHGEGGSGLVHNWQPSVPILMSPSGCHISLESTFQPLWSSQPLSQRCLHLIFLFLCYIVCRILILWPGVEMVPLALEAQRHNHWTSRKFGHPRKSWCLHLRNFVVSSNVALAPPSPGDPSWSTPGTNSKLRPHSINTTQVTLSLDMYLLSAYLSGWHGHSWRQNKPFS